LLVNNNLWDNLHLVRFWDDLHQVRSKSIKISNSFACKQQSNVPDEGYPRNVPAEGYPRNVPDEGYHRDCLQANELLIFIVFEGT
jgi:hypothetical protein